MADYGGGLLKSFSEGYGAMEEVQQAQSSKDILKQAYAGVSPEEAADPAKQQSIYQQAAAMAGQQGLGAVAHSFNKQAASLNSNASAKQLKDLEVKEKTIEYANNLLSGAQSDEDLQRIIEQEVTDPAARLQVASIMRNPKLTSFEERKKVLVDMTSNAQNRIAAQKILADAEYKKEQAANLIADNARADAASAAKQSKTEQDQEAEKRKQTEKERAALISEERKQKELDEREKTDREREKQRDKENANRDKEWGKRDAIAERRIALAEEKAAAAPKEQARSYRAAQYADVVAIAGNEISTSISNITSLPVTISSGIFGGTSKKTLFEAPIEALKNTLSDDAVQRYNVEIGNVGKYYATMLNGGMLATKGAGDQYTEQFRVKAGDSEKTKLTKLAQMRQTFEKAAEIKLNSKATPIEQKELWRGFVKQVQEDVPFTVKQLNELETASKKGKAKTTIGDLYAQTAKQIKEVSTSKAGTPAVSSEELDLINKHRTKQ